MINEEDDVAAAATDDSIAQRVAERRRRRPAAVDAVAASGDASISRRRYRYATTDYASDAASFITMPSSHRMLTRRADGDGAGGDDDDRPRHPASIDAISTGWLTSLLGRTVGSVRGAATSTETRRRRRSPPNESTAPPPPPSQQPTLSVADIALVTLPGEGDDDDEQQWQNAPDATQQDDDDDDDAVDVEDVDDDGDDDDDDDDDQSGTTIGAEMIIDAPDSLVRARADELTRKGQTLLHAMAQNGCNAKLINAELASRPHHLNATDARNRTPLWHAVWCANDAATIALMRAGAVAVGVVDTEGIGLSVLHLAAKRDGTLTRLVIDAIRAREGDVGVRTALSCCDAFGRTPLHVAVRRYDAVRALLDAGAKADARDGDGDTPLHSVMSRKKPPTSGIITMMGRANRDALSAVDHRGAAPLHRAVLRGWLDATRELLACGADPNQMATIVESADGRRESARARRHQQITPLHVALVQSVACANAREAHTIRCIVSSLLHCGADTRAPIRLPSQSLAIGVDLDSCRFVASMSTDTELAGILELWRAVTATDPPLFRLSVDDDDTEQQQASAAPPSLKRRKTSSGAPFVAQQTAAAAAAADQTTCCCVCMGAPRSVANVPCGHVTLCIDCANRCALSIGAGKPCAVCREPVKITLRLYA